MIADEFDSFMYEFNWKGQNVQQPIRNSFHVWTCPSCHVLQRMPKSRRHPRCLCGEPMPGERRVPAAERCEITDETNRVARRLVELALG